MCQLKTARISLVKDALIHMNLYFSETVIEFESLNCYKISSGSRPGHKVSGTRSKFPNLNENGQKFFVRLFRLATRSTFCLDPPLI